MTLQTRLRALLAVGLLLIGMSACAQEGAATPEPTAVVAEVEPTALPEPPDTAVPPTNAPIPTDTATPEPTATATTPSTETPTATPSPTNTPLPTDTPAPTAVPPTAVPVATAVPPTPVPATAHTFPETPIQPFDVDTFTRYLGLTRDSYRSFNSEMGLFQQTNKPGDCGTFIGWTMLWILDAPGFTDVPAAWQPLYVEYRSLLQQIVTITTEIRPLCDARGGEVSPETTQAIVDFLGWAYPRSEAMVGEAAQLPRP